VQTLVGAIVVHQGRYLLAPPDHVHEGIHSYLAWAIPLICFLVVIGVAELLARLDRRETGEPLLPPASVLFAVFTLVLLAIFGAQESIEMALGHGALVLDGNPLIADGAWVAIPLAMAAGAVLALLLRGAALVIALAFRRRRSLPRPSRRPLARLSSDRAPRSSGISRSLAPRGPPLRLI